MKVKYTGTSNYRELESRDFDKMGVDQKKLTFERNVPHEVSDEVGQALLDHELVAGEFEEVKDEEERKTSKRSRRSSDDSEMDESGTAQESTGGPTGTAGRGSSTTGTGGTGGTTRGGSTRTR